jgi:hypothetical protein
MIYAVYVVTVVAMFAAPALYVAWRERRESW